MATMNLGLLRELREENLARGGDDDTQLLRQLRKVGGWVSDLGVDSSRSTSPPPNNHHGTTNTHDGHDEDSDATDESGEAGNAYLVSSSDDGGNSSDADGDDKEEVLAGVNEVKKSARVALSHRLRHGRLLDLSFSTADGSTMIRALKRLRQGSDSSQRGGAGEVWDGGDITSITGRCSFQLDAAVLEEIFTSIRPSTGNEEEVGGSGGLLSLDLGSCHGLTTQGLESLFTAAEPAGCMAGIGSSLLEAHLPDCPGLSDRALGGLCRPRTIGAKSSPKCCSLRRLSLQLCTQLTSAGIFSLLTAGSLKVLRWLDLGQTGCVTDAVLSVLFSIGCPNIQYLDISMCLGITDQGVESCGTSQSLETLCLSNNPQLTSDCLQPFSDNVGFCRRLEDLYFQGCTGISAKAISVLRQKRPYIHLEDGDEDGDDISLDE